MRPPISGSRVGGCAVSTASLGDGAALAFIGHRFDLRRGMTGIGSHLRHMSRTLQFDLPRHPTRAFVLRSAAVQSSMIEPYYRAPA